MFQKSEPIGLSLMIVLSECYLQKTECQVIMETLNYKIASKTLKRFVDDSHLRFQERSHADKLSEILNKQDLAIKYTVEYEDRKHSLMPKRKTMTVAITPTQRKSRGTLCRTKN